MDFSKETIMKGLWDVILLALSGVLCIVGSKIAVEKALASASVGPVQSDVHGVKKEKEKEKKEEKESSHKKEKEGEQGKSESGVSRLPGGGVPYPLKTTVVNLAGDSDHRFAKVSITLELTSEKVSEKMKSLDYQVYDVLIKILGNVRAQEVGTEIGKEKVKDTIRLQLNHILDEDGVSEVYLTEFLVQ